MCIRRSSEALPFQWTPSSARPSKWITALLVPSSTRALQPGICREEVYVRQRPPRHSRCLAKGAASFSLAPLPGGSVSFTVTEPFSLLPPRHCVDVSLLLVVAVGIRCHTGGWHIVHEAPRLATCPPMLVIVHAHFSAAPWKKTQQKNPAVRDHTSGRGSSSIPDS